MCRVYKRNLLKTEPITHRPILNLITLAMKKLMKKGRLKKMKKSKRVQTCTLIRRRVSIDLKYRLKWNSMFKIKTKTYWLSKKLIIKANFRSNLKNMKRNYRELSYSFNSSCNRCRLINRTSSQRQ